MNRRRTLTAVAAGAFLATTAVVAVVVTDGDGPTEAVSAAPTTTSSTAGTTTSSAPAQTTTIPPPPPPPPPPTAAPAPATTLPPPGPMAAVEPARIVVPALGVDAPVIRLGLQRDGTLEVPATAHEVGWWSGGTLPGTTGPAVLAGHVNLGDQRGVFARLAELAAGDRIDVAADDGTTISYVVTRVERHPKDASPTDAVYDMTAGPELRLITAAATSTGPRATTRTTSSPSPRRRESARHVKRNQSERNSRRTGSLTQVNTPTVNSAASTIAERSRARTGLE